MGFSIPSGRGPRVRGKPRSGEVMKILLTAVAGLALASAAHGQWSDNFDSYPTGSINGLGGGKGWDNVAPAAGTVTTDQFRSGPNSQAISSPLNDSVRTYAAIASGAW